MDFESSIKYIFIIFSFLEPIMDSGDRLPGSDSQF